MTNADSASLDKGASGGLGETAASVHQQGRGAAIARTAAGLLSAQAISWLTTLLSIFIVPRFLGTASFGVLVGAQTMGDVVSTAAAFGTNNYVVRESARAPKESATLVLTASLIRLGISISLYLPLFAVLLLFFIGDGVTLLVYAFVSIWAMTGAIQGAHLSGLQAQHRVGKTAIGTALIFMVGQVVVATGLFLDFGVVWVAASGMVTASFVMLYTARRFWVEVGGTASASVSRAQQMLRECRMFALWDIGLFVFRGSDIIMLTVLASASAAGIAGFAARLLSVPSILYTILAMAVFPTLAWASENDMPWFRRQLTRCTELVILASVGISAVLVTQASFLVTLIGSTEFADAIIVLQIGACAVPFIAVGTALGTGIWSMNRQRVWAIVAWVGVTSNIAGNAIAIPVADAFWGQPAAGAAVVTVIVQVYMAGAAAWVLRDTIDISELWFFSGLVAVSMLPTLFCLIVLPYWIGAIPAMLAAGVAFAGITIAARLVTIDEVRELLGSFRRSRAGEPAQPGAIS